MELLPFALAFVLVIFHLIGLYNKASFMFAPVIGVVLGALYSFTDYEDSTEHTLQVVIFVISISIVWETPKNG